MGAGNRTLVGWRIASALNQEVVFPAVASNSPVAKADLEFLISDNRDVWPPHLFHMLLGVEPRGSAC